MTNKLPEIGKRYRYKDLHKQREYPPIKIDAVGKLYVVAENSKLEDRDILTREENVCYTPTRVFFDIFEELPDQEKPEVQLTQPIVSEVEKAKEKLKEALNAPLPWDLNYSWLETKAQNLIDALDRQNWEDCSKMKDRYTPDFNSIIESQYRGKNQEETKKESEECAVCNHEKYNRPLTATEFKNHAKHLGAPNFYSEEKPQSIWKPLNMLPKLPFSIPVLIRFKNQDMIYGLVIEGQLCEEWNRSYDHDNIESWCHLPRLIDYIENIEERLRKLEKKIEN